MPGMEQPFLMTIFINMPVRALAHLVSAQPGVKYEIL